MSEPVHSEGRHRFATDSRGNSTGHVLGLEALHDGVAEAESVISTSGPVHRYLGREDSYKSAIVHHQSCQPTPYSLINHAQLTPFTQWMITIKNGNDLAYFQGSGKF
uniref:Uncharacterized protein n=1 Tax=Coccidioides posadasii RMSCC 3488 TaxID=454284 RepID=A0A0J6FVB0_COCPO|nr:hypothetical protein CPAG_09378 [Coccidioides posadasii RMSCC 3488]